MTDARTIAQIRDQIMLYPDQATDYMHALVVAALTTRAIEVYELVQKHGELTVNQVVAELGMHPNMARGILAMLHSCKLLDRHQRTGRKSPVWVYKRKADAA